MGPTFHRTPTRARLHTITTDHVVGLLHEGGRHGDLLSQNQQRHADEHRHENDLQRVAFCEGREEVSRHDVQHHVHQLRRVEGLAAPRGYGKEGHHGRSRDDRKYDGIQDELGDHPLADAAEGDHISDAADAPCHREEYHGPGYGGEKTNECVEKGRDQLIREREAGSLRHEPAQIAQRHRYYQGDGQRDHEGALFPLGGKENTVDPVLVLPQGRETHLGHHARQGPAVGPVLLRQGVQGRAGHGKLHPRGAKAPAAAEGEPLRSPLVPVAQQRLLQGQTDPQGVLPLHLVRREEFIGGLPGVVDAKVCQGILLFHAFHGAFLLV